MNNFHKTNIKLIAVVEKFPELWDYSHEKYANKLHTEKVWNEIGKEMDTTGANCRLRWGTLRGNFSRALKPTSNGISSKIKKEYYLSPYLKFLLPFMKSKLSNANIWIDPNQSQRLVEQTHLDTKENVKKTSENEMYFEANLLATEQKPSMKFNHSDIFDNSTGDYVNQNQKQNATDAEQANLNFFKSLLPDMARLDPKTCNDFKISIMGQLNDLLYGMDPLAKTLRMSANTAQGYNSYGEQYVNQSIYHV